MNIERISMRFDIENKAGIPIGRVSDPVWYWPDPDPDPTSQDKPDPDPDPDTSVLKIFHLFYDEF